MFLAGRHFLKLLIFLSLGISTQAFSAKRTEGTTTAEPIVFMATGNAYGAASGNVTTRTTYTEVKANVTLPRPLVTASIFDPEVEFLEIAVTINGKRTWKIYGPDLDGRFGGLQGIGGLEATIQVTGNVSTGLLTDVFGNGVGAINGSSLVWHRNRSGSYGALPGHEALTPNETVTVAQATGWRGKTADITGFYNLGARYYEPNGGRFLSADPAGHSASISLYDYANGDPVNFADPDGRIGKAIDSALGLNTSNHYSGVTSRPPSYGTINNSFTSSQSLSGMALLSAFFNSIPALGTVKSFIELSSGNDLFTGERISSSQSTFNVLSSAIPFAAGSIGKFGTQAIGTSMGGLSSGAMNFSRPAMNIGGGSVTKQAAKGGAIPTSTAIVPYYPQANGVAGTTTKEFLMPGQTIDRFGGSGASRFFSPTGTSEAARALPPGTAGQQLRTFEVVKPFEVETGKVAPWFNQPGGGTQFRTPVTLETLLKRGILKEQ